MFPLPGSPITSKDLKGRAKIWQNSITVIGHKKKKWRMYNIQYYIILCTKNNIFYAQVIKFRSLSYVNYSNTLFGPAYKN